MSETQVINLDAFNAASLTESPFPFVVMNNFLQSDKLQAILEDFPKMKAAGLYPNDVLNYGEAMQQLVAELSGDGLRKAVAEKFSTPLDDCPAMITFRGYARFKDGRIHHDTKSKVVSMLLYFNEEWPYQGGRLRLLRDPNDIESTILEIPPLAGAMVMFKVTTNGWHGHHKFIGQRRAIMVNYMTDRAAYEREVGKHRFSARMKNLKSLFGIGRLPEKPVDCPTA